MIGSRCQEVARMPDEEERHQMTLEALEDVDAGRVVAHAAVQAWAERLGTKKPLPRPAK